ncbi:flippase [Phocaeicola sp.]
MLSIKRNFLYSSILTVSGYLFPLMTYPYISRILGVDNIGLCNFIDSIINYFVLFSMLGIGIVGVREIAKNKTDKEGLSLCFRDIIVFNLVSTLIVEVVLLSSVFFIPQLYVHKEMVFIGALKLLANVFLIEWFYKGMEEFRYITLRSIIVKAVYVISVFLFIHKAEDYAVYYLLLTGMYVVNAILNWTYLRRFLSFTVKSACPLRYGRTIAVMGCYSILTSMYTTFNVIYLGFIAGETEVGYYTTATKLYTIIMALFTAFTGVMLPRMSALVAEGRMDEFNRLTDLSCTILFKFSLPLVALTVIYAPEIVHLISGDGYEGAVTPMRIVMPLMVIIGYEQIIIVQTLMPLKKDKAVFINSMVGAVVGLMLNFLLVPYFKSIGSAIVWVCSEVAVMLSAQHFVFKCTSKPFPLQSFFKEVWRLMPVLFFFGVLGIVCQLYVNSVVYAMALSILFILAYYWVCFKSSTFKQYDK